MMHCLEHGVGIDLGATQIKMLAVDAEGNIIRQVVADTRDGASSNLAGGASSDRAAGCSEEEYSAPRPSLPAWLETIRAQLTAWERELGAAREVGLCAPGLALPEARAIGWMPGRLQGLEGLDWTQALGRDVRVLNDGHAALLGEHWQGAARGARHAVMFTLGTGVGGAILSHGKLMRGAIGRAGHLGHMSLDPHGTPGITGCPGCLEDAIGNCTLPRRSGGRFSDTAALLATAREGDAEAAKIWQESLDTLGAAIVSMINLVDPEVVLLGGGMIDAGAALFGPVQDYLDAHEWRPGGASVRLVPAMLGGLAGALGALYYARNFGELH